MTDLRAQATYWGREAIDCLRFAGYLERGAPANALTNEQRRRAAGCWLRRRALHAAMREQRFERQARLEAEAMTQRQAAELRRRG